MITEFNEHCIWTFQSWEEYYTTACNHDHQFYQITFDESEYKYCPYCGRPIEVTGNEQDEFVNEI